MKKILTITAAVLVIGFTGCTTKVNDLGMTECRGVITDRIYPCSKIDTIYEGAKTAYGLGKKLVLVNGYWIPEDVMNNLEKLDSVANKIDTKADKIRDAIKASAEKKQVVESDSLTDKLN